MTKLNLTTPFLVLVILVCLFGWLRSCDKIKEYKATADHISGVQAKIAKIHEWQQVALRRIDSIHTARRNDSLNFALRERALNASVVHWKKKALESRPAVVVMSDSVPVLKAYIAATDSVIQKQDSTIAVQGGHIIAQAKLYKIEIAAMAEKNITQQKLTEVWQSESYRQEKEAGKATRWKKVWRSAALVLGATTAVLILAK